MTAPVSALEARKIAATLREQGRHVEAAAELQQAVTDSREDADAHAELGLTFTLMGRPSEAEASFRRALQIRPGDVFALSNLGGALLLLRQVDEAERCFRCVLDLQPGHPQALRNLSVILRDTGRLAEAKACALEAFSHAPSLNIALQAHLALAPIAGSAPDIDAQRRSYKEGLATLAASTAPLAYGGEKANLPWFYLAYHGVDDRDFATRTAAAVLSKVQAPDTGGGATPTWSPPTREGRRIRVAFCSEFFSAHTIGRLYKGLMQRLDRDRFEVTVLHGSHSKADAFRAELDAQVDRAIHLPLSPSAQRQIIRALKLDILFYPDIGMSAQTYFLAAERLAPVQATSWGHPDTTGLPTVDYFLSAAGAEPPEAQDHYRERLIRLPRLPAFYEKPHPIPALARSALGLPETGTLYGCPQSLFKFHPEFDGVLGAICRQDPAARIVLIEAANPAWTAALLARWSRSEPILGERVCLLPRLSHQGFLAHLAHLDVLLDPLHFGSGNTLYEGMAAGVPIVTLPGKFMRGRLVAAAYAQMGVVDAPVAHDAGAYAATAVALANDVERRGALGAELRAKASQQLFEDGFAIQAFEAFLTAAVEATAAGGYLPQAWSPRLPEPVT